MSANIFVLFDSMSLSLVVIPSQKLSQRLSQFCIEGATFDHLIAISGTFDICGSSEEVQPPAPFSDCAQASSAF